MNRAPLHVDCSDCAARGPACEDCVISVVLGAPGGGVDLDPDEQSALAALAESGLVPPLRLAPRYRYERARDSGHGRRPESGPETGPQRQSAG